jgi:predicted ferric reductase
VTPLNHNTYELRLTPSKTPVFTYAPGQFAFLRLYREKGSAQEHPFTISSSPTASQDIAFTIKACGDFTATVGQTRPGDQATVDGPYGRFSYLMWRGESPLVMIAGGVGITPMLSGLRHMRDTGYAGAVTLIWANRTQADTFLSQELAKIQQTLGHLVIHHVFSREAHDGQPQGHLDRDRLAALLPDIPPNTHIMLCGPGPMMDTVSKALRKLGIQRRYLHRELFAL